MTGNGKAGERTEVGCGKASMDNLISDNGRMERFKDLGFML